MDGNTERLPEECSCYCHTYAGTLHIMACCHVCPYCGKNIEHMKLQVHIREHHPEQAEG